MNEVGYLSAVVLAMTFAGSGIAKLLDRTDTVGGFTELRVPRPQVLALAIPMFEVSLVAVLVLLPRIGGLGALVALSCFSALLGARIREGAPVRCACFGSRSAEEISVVDLLRNGMLAVLAVAALVPTTPVAPSLPAVVTVSAVVAAGVALLGVARLVREVRTSERLRGFVAR